MKMSFKALVAIGLSGLTCLALAQSEDAPQKELQAKIAALPWQAGPTTGAVSDKATLKVADKQAFLDMPNSDKFLQLNGNLPNPGRNVIATDSWFAVFDFDAVGYVKDDEKIDADDLLSKLKEGNVAQNEERKKQGYSELILDGWYMPPKYDAQSKHLEWATRLHSGQSTIVNYTVRLLGRTGVERATLVSSPQTLEKNIPEFKAVLNGFEFNAGERYTEFKQGDRVAEFGLAALVAGGAAAVAVKTGFWKVLLGGLAAFWKVIAAGAVAVMAGLKNIFKGKKSSANGGDSSA